MIKTIKVTNYLGDSITLDLMRPELSGFIVKNITGLGPAKATINTAEVSTNDGSLFNSARLDNRNIVLTLSFMETWNEDGSMKESIETIRQKTYKYFPVKKPLKFIIETDNRTVMTKGYVESNSSTIFSKEEGTQISIVCPDPYMYSVEENNNNTAFYGTTPMFEFPFENESLTENMIVFANIVSKTENYVTYEGDAEIGITIIIHATGSASNINVYNTQTREKMSIDTSKIEALTGSGIINGDTITINTMKGSKGITLLRDSIETNILNCLSKDTAWFTLSKGDNIFTYTAESGASNLQFSITNKVIYEGI